MNDLQTGLALLGASLIAGIFVFSRIQEYRHRRMVEQVLPDPGKDALMDGEAAPVRSEPGFAQPAAARSALSALICSSRATDSISSAKSARRASLTGPLRLAS